MRGDGGRDGLLLLFAALLTGAAFVAEVVRALAGG